MSNHKCSDCGEPHEERRLCDACFTDAAKEGAAALITESIGYNFIMFTCACLWVVGMWKLYIWIPRWWNQLFGG